MTTDNGLGPRRTGGAATTRTRTRSRRGGRPTLEEAVQLDHDVREAALRLFLEHGYEGTSMDAIASAAGTTKASIYARFPSRDALFKDVLDWAVMRPDWPVVEPELPPVDDLEDALRAIAHSVVRRVLDPSMVKLSRIAIAHAARFPAVASRIQAGAWPRRQLVTELLERHAAAGEIVAEEPEILAEHFLAMVAAGPARLASFGIVRDAEDQEHHIEVALQLFLRGLRT